MNSPKFLKTFAAWVIPATVFLAAAPAAPAQELKEQIASLESKIRFAEKKTEKLRAEIDKLKEEMTELDNQAIEAQEIQKAVDAKLEERKGQQDEARAYETTIKNAMALIEAYREGFRSQVKFEKGEMLGDFKMSDDGRDITGATVSGISADKIQVRHSNGFLVLKFDDLPISLQDRITKPPKSATLDSTVLLAEKPSTLVTEVEAASLAAVKSAKTKEEMEDAVEQRRLELIARTERMRKEREAGTRKNQADRARMVAEQTAKLAENRKLNAQIDVLEDEIVTFKDALEAQDTAMNDAITKLSAASIRTSAADYQKIKDPYIKKMRAIRTAMDAKSREIAVLKRKLSY